MNYANEINDNKISLEDDKLTDNIVDSDDDTGSSVKPEWKKKKIDDDERLTLRIDSIEAERYRDRHNKAAIVKKTKTKKTSKKVKQLYEDDEDDEVEVDQDTIRSLRELHLTRQDISNGDTSLIDALIPEEKRLLEQAMIIENNRHQQNAGKLNAVEQADTLSRKAGLSKMSTSEQMEITQEAIYNPRRMREKALEKNIENKTGIKGKIHKGDGKNVAKGVKNIEETTNSRKTPKLNMEDVNKIGKKNMSQTKTAELILEKSGKTAKVSDAKMRQAYDQDVVKNTKKKEINEDGVQKNNKEKQIVNKDVKELLNEALRKNDKVR